MPTVSGVSFGWFGVIGPYLKQWWPNLGTVLTSANGTNWVIRHFGPELTSTSLVNDRLAVVSSDAGLHAMHTSDPLVTLQHGLPGQVTVRRAAGMTVVVQWTEDLQTWHTLTNLAAGLPVETVTDTVTNAPKRFYRAHTP